MEIIRCIKCGGRDLELIGKSYDQVSTAVQILIAEHYKCRSCNTITHNDLHPEIRSS